MTVLDFFNAYKGDERLHYWRHCLDVKPKGITIKTYDSQSVSDWTTRQESMNENKPALQAARRTFPMQLHQKAKSTNLAK